MENLKKFNILLEDGSLIKECTVFSNFGHARNVRDIKNALSKENRIIIDNKYINKGIIQAKNVYDVEMN